MTTAQKTETLMTGIQPVIELADVLQFPSQVERGFLFEEPAAASTPALFDSEQLAALTEQPFHIAQGEVRVPGAYDKVPYTITVATDLMRSTPHMIIPGFGGFKRTTRLVRNGISADHNSAAISYDPVRRSQTKESLLHSQRVHVDTISAILNDLPNNKQLKNIPNGDKLDLNQVILDPHSMGGLAATTYARAHPNEIPLITYLESVGLEDPNLFRFIGRLIPTFTKDIGPAVRRGELDNGAARLVMLQRVTRYYLRNPVRTIGEMGSCISGDSRKEMAWLGQHGVKMAMVYGRFDELMPAKPAVKGARHLVDSYDLLDIGHVGPQSRLHAGKVATALATAAENLLYTEAA